MALATPRRTKAPDAVRSSESSDVNTSPDAWRIQLTTAVPPLATAGDNSPRAVTTSGFQPVHRKPKAKRNRKGWGPYRSVTKERSVDFNLTLDVQHLKMEIQQLETTRDLLHSMRLQQRHSPNGSLVRVVREYFQLFRQGFRVEERTRRRHVITAGVQRDFLLSVVDEDIDFGNGRGLDFMIEQIRRYSLLLRFICMKMDSTTIVLTDNDGVMIKAHGTLRFQVLRETIMAVFPHILGNEVLCSKLIGAEVEATSVITFHFNTNDRMCGYEPDADFVMAFNEVLRDPEDVLELLGQAKIGEKSTLEVAHDWEVDDLEADQSASGSVLPVEDDHGLRQTTSDNHARGHYSRTPLSLDYRAIVSRYIMAFSRGWHHHIAEIESQQRAFLLEFVSPNVIFGDFVGHVAIENAWKALCTSFELLNYRVASEPKLAVHEASTSVHVRVLYDLSIDISTIHAVFPEILRHPELVQALLGAEITCPSDLWFEWMVDHPDHRVARLVEQFDWDTALLALLPNPTHRAFLLQHAKLTADGHVRFESGS